MHDASMESAAAASSSDATTSSSWSTVASHAPSPQTSTLHQQPQFMSKDYKYYSRRGSPSKGLPVSQSQLQPAFNKNSAMRALDIDDELGEIRSTPSWAQRIPWFGKHKRRKRRLRSSDVAASIPQQQLLDSLDYSTGDAVYYRYDRNPSPAMQVAAARTAASNHPSTLIDNSNVPPQTSNWQRVASWITSLSHELDDPLQDPEEDPDISLFTEEDWTPPDSSYGAAIPVGGCIPKKIRRLIEWTILGSLFLGVVLFLIATSIRLRSDGDSSSAASKGSDSSNTMNNYYYALNETFAVTDEYSDEYGNDENDGSSGSSSSYYSNTDNAYN